MKIYIGIFFIAFIIFAYLAGGKIAKEKCQAEMAEKSQMAQVQSIEKSEKINAGVTGFIDGILEIFGITG